MAPSAATAAAAVALAALVLIATLPQARGILCYQCNSKRDAECGEQLPPPPVNATARYLRRCEDGPNGEPAFCRRSVIKVLAANEGRGETRWVRACGWVRHRAGAADCYQFDDDDHHEHVCQCFHDACNAAPSLPALPTSLLLLLLPLLAL